LFFGFYLSFVVVFLILKRTIGYAFYYIFITKKLDRIQISRV